MKKVLFLIHDLHQGSAERVLVNLVNNMDPEQFEIHVTALFGGGVNEQFLKPHVRYLTAFPRPFRGNSHLMKLLSPGTLHRLFIREHYDIEVSYLEGPSARIVSGCPDPDTKLVTWIHCTMHSPAQVGSSFRSAQEATECYNRMDAMVYVAGTVRDAFLNNCPYSGNNLVMYNTNESEKILEMAAEEAAIPGVGFHWCGVGTVCF